MLKWLDRLNPTITQLYQTVEQQAEKCPEAQRLTTHPGMGPLTVLASVLTMRTTDRFHYSKLIASFVGLVPLEKSSGNRRRLGQITERAEFAVAFLAGGSGSSNAPQHPGKGDGVHKNTEKLIGRSAPLHRGV
jgi:transposase